MNQERLMGVLLSPHISTKSSALAQKHRQNRQVVFRVLRDANKADIKKAVELMFDVKVMTVRVCNVKGKVKRFRQIRGRRSGYKKAYVKLEPGYDIELMRPE
jgi:Ribosomal protein L23